MTEIKIKFNLKINEDTWFHIFDISVILSDSNDSEINRKARENIELVVEKKWIYLSDCRKIWQYLEYNEIYPTNKKRR